MNESFERPRSSFDEPASTPAPPVPHGAEQQAPTPHGADQHPPAPQGTQTAVLQNKNSDLAVVSMILGIFGVLSGFFCIGFPFAVAAIVCGHIARGKIKREQLKGNGFAIAGLVTGYLVVVLSILFGLFLVLAMFVSDSRPTGPVYQVPSSIEVSPEAEEVMMPDEVTD